jgi:hypothetical protein
VFQRKDIPRHIMQLKRQTEEFASADFVGVRPTPWNASTDPREAERRNRLSQNRRDINLGLYQQKPHTAQNPLSAEKISELKSLADLWQQKGGPHAVKSEGWNGSTIVDQAVLKYPPQLRARSLPPQEYVKPSEATSELGDLLRQKKVQYSGTREEIKRELRQLYPSASDERLVAMSFRLLDEKLLAEEKLRRQPIANESHRPNLSLTAIDRRFKVRMHPGVYTPEGWSCCLNNDPNSGGCESKIANPDRWCLLGFT